ncbi:MAG: trypsin-like serine protease [Rhizonema sp. NSF051]|nr:trypsin-like serine protease [Rhizonema sp. NSF051]
MSTKLYQILSACLLFPALIGLVAVRAQSEPLPLHNGALSPDDPAAKLDPRLQNVPEKVAPLSSHIDTTNSGTTEVSYNTNTGIVQIGPTKPPQTIVPLTSSDAIEPSLGSAPNSVAKPEKSSSSGITPQSVIGSDDRILINDTTVYPWRAMTKLYITYPDEKSFTCSGVLISAKYVLTAGHCVHDPSHGGFAKTVEVVPGLNGTYKPYGSFSSTNIRSYKNWTDNQDPNYDIALITLNQSLGDTVGWLGLANYPSVDGVTAYIAGYPGDKDNALKLYYGYGPILSSTAQRLNYTIDMYNGQSGSGIYRIINDQRYVFGVNTNNVPIDGSSSTNSGTRIDSAKYNDIQAWISSGN